MTLFCIVLVQNTDKIPLVNCPVLVIHVSISCLQLGYVSLFHIPVISNGDLTLPFNWDPSLLYVVKIYKSHQHIQTLVRTLDLNACFEFTFIHANNGKVERDIMSDLLIHMSKTIWFAWCASGDFNNIFYSLVDWTQCLTWNIHSPVNWFFLSCQLKAVALNISLQSLSKDTVNEVVLHDTCIREMLFIL